MQDDREVVNRGFNEIGEFYAELIKVIRDNGGRAAINTTLIDIDKGGNSWTYTLTYDNLNHHYSTDFKIFVEANDDDYVNDWPDNLAKLHNFQSVINSLDNI